MPKKTCTMERDSAIMSTSYYVKAVNWFDKGAVSMISVTGLQLHGRDTPRNHTSKTSYFLLTIVSIQNVFHQNR